MKAKLTILTLLISLNISANPAAFASFIFFTGWWTPAANHFVHFNQAGILHHYESNGAIISLSQDPSMAFQRIWDIKLSGGYKIGKWVYEVAYEEAFHPIYLQEYIIGVRYQFTDLHPDIFRIRRDLMFYTGYEIGRRNNEGQKVWVHRPYIQVDWLHQQHDFGLSLNFGYTPRQELTNPAVKFREPYDFMNGNFFAGIGIYLLIRTK